MTQKLNTDNGLQGRWTRTTGYNSTYPKGGLSCSKDSFVVNQTLFFQIKFCGKSPALRVAAKRYLGLGRIGNQLVFCHNNRTTQLQKLLIRDVTF